MAVTRDQILFMLSKAAQLEIMLCNAYLFAAFSTKRSNKVFADEANGDFELATNIVNWTQQISFVARQEMEHLALVNNIITAVGGAPYFNHPNFPMPPGYTDYDLALERLNHRTMDRFIAFESPEGQNDPIKLPEGNPAPVPVDFNSIGQLYGEILRAMKEFPGGESALFIGPQGSQLDGSQLMLTFPRKGQLGGVYGLTIFAVTDMATAQQAIELIVEQGEGSFDDSHELIAEIDPNDVSHFERFSEIRAQMEGIDEDRISHPVVKNPVLFEKNHGPESTLVTAAPAREAMAVFNAAYEITLLLLMRLFFHTDESEEELEALREVAFFPMMTMMIRPIGEILVTLPAFEDGTKGNAGPSFETFRSTNFLPHKAAAWQALSERLEELADATKASAETLKSAGFVDQATQMAYCADSVALTRRRLRNSLGMGE